MAGPFLEQLRHAVGLRPMLAVPARISTAAAAGSAKGSSAASGQAAAAAAKPALPAFKQYREADGRFYFKLAAADGTLLLQSRGLDDAREAGAWVKRLKSEGAAALEGAPVELPADVPRDSVARALAALQSAEA